MALEADLRLETEQLERYRERFARPTSSSWPTWLRRCAPCSSRLRSTCATCKWFWGTDAPEFRIHASSAAVPGVPPQALRRKHMLHATERSLSDAQAGADTSTRCPRGSRCASGRIVQSENPQRVGAKELGPYLVLEADLWHLGHDALEREPHREVAPRR